VRTELVLHALIQEVLRVKRIVPLPASAMIVSHKRSLLKPIAKRAGSRVIQSAAKLIEEGVVARINREPTMATA